jgi:hypothetical protein
MDLTPRRRAIGVLAIAPLLMASDCSTTNRFVEMVPTRSVQDGAVYVRLDRLAVTDRGWGGASTERTGTFDVFVDAGGVHPLASGYPFAEAEPVDRGPVGNGLRYVSPVYGDGTTPRWTLPTDAECIDASFAVGSPDRKTVLVGQGCKTSVRLYFLTADGAERRTVRVPREGGILGSGFAVANDDRVALRSRELKTTRFFASDGALLGTQEVGPFCAALATGWYCTTTNREQNLLEFRGIAGDLRQSLTFVPVAVTSVYANYGPADRLIPWIFVADDRVILLLRATNPTGDILAPRAAQYDGFGRLLRDDALAAASSAR